MNFWKIIFWSMTILVGFVNPVISFGLVILYYLPGIVNSVCKQCFEAQNTTQNLKNEPELPNSNYYSTDTLEEMK
jgi:hypothetical protein